MFRANDLKILSNIKGWRQNYNTDDFKIDDDLVASDFGQYYQGVHPLLTLDNLKSIAPNFENVTFPTWLVGTPYLIGDVVNRNGKDYESTQDGTGQDPETAPTFWKDYDAFSNWLRIKTKEFVLGTLTLLHTEKIANKTANNLLSSKFLYDGAARISNTEAPTNKTVGFELVPIRAKGVTVKIDKIGLQFAGPAEALTVDIMHSSQIDPVKSLTLTRTKSDSLEWFTPEEDLYLDYDSVENGAGGSWYIKYNQSALGAGVEAVVIDRDWSRRPQQITTRSPNLENTLSWNKYLEVYPFEVVDAGLKLWDVADSTYTYSSNHGMNLQITVQCDTTNIILEQKRSFENIIGLGVALGFLREMAYNPAHNINRTQQNFSRQELLYELDGDSTSYKKSGLNHEFDRAMMATSVDFDKMSRICMTCRNRGIRIQSI